MSESSFYKQFTGITQQMLNIYLSNACYDGELDTVKYLLTSPELKKHAELSFNNDPLHFACQNGQLEIIKYLLTTPGIKEKVNIHSDDDYALTGACDRGQLEIVKYLLTSPELEEHANSNYALNSACYNGHLDIVKYLLTSPELKENVNIHASDDIAFKVSYAEDQIKILQYLIFDLNIQKTPTIEKLFDSSSGDYNPLMQKVENMFTVRDLNRQLEHDLSLNEDSVIEAKRNKI